MHIDMCRCRHRPFIYFFLSSSYRNRMRAAMASPSPIFTYYIATIAIISYYNILFILIIAPSCMLIHFRQHRLINNNFAYIYFCVVAFLCICSKSRWCRWMMKISLAQLIFILYINICFFFQSLNFRWKIVRPPRELYEKKETKKRCAMCAIAWPLVARLHKVTLPPSRLDHRPKDIHYFRYSMLNNGTKIDRFFLCSSLRRRKKKHTI